MASEGILSGFNFKDVDQHPIGIASIATFIRLFDLDPLIVLYYLQPLLAGICFIILFKILSSVVPSTYAFFISLNSMSSLIMIKAMNQITAEIISLTVILILIAYVWKYIILERNNNLTNAGIMILLSWITIIFRHTSIFIVIGILLFLFHRKYFRIIHLIFIGFLSILPGVIKTLFYYKEASFLEKIFDWSFLLEFMNQIYKHLLNLTEIIFPYSLHLNAIPLLKLFIITFSLLVLIYFTDQKKEIYQRNNKAVVLGEFFLITGLSYYILLSLASIFYEYDWGSLYRVSGFGILFILNSFWIYIYIFAVDWKKIALIFIILLPITKIGYGIRYEKINQNYRFLFQDYRSSIESLIGYIDNGLDDVFVLVGETWQGTNLFYMLQYYDMIYSLPFRVHKYHDANSKTISVLVCTKMDLNKNLIENYDLSRIGDKGDVIILKSGN